MRAPTANIPEESHNPALPMGVHLISLLAGCAFLFFGWKSMKQEYPLLHKLTHLSEAYRPTQARMIQVKTRRDTTLAGDAYHPDVLYEYFVVGKSIWGWRFSHEEEPQSRTFWERRLSAYRSGDTLTAYVNPKDSTDSILEKKTDGLSRSLFKTLMAGIFVLFGATLLGIAAMTLLGKLRRLIQ